MLEAKLLFKAFHRKENSFEAMKSKPGISVNEFEVKANN
jgi:hypothetical protein